MSARPVQSAHQGVAGEVSEGLCVDGFHTLDVLLEVVDVTDRQTNCRAPAKRCLDQRWQLGEETPATRPGQ
jgi:hypothetical protein